MMPVIRQYQQSGTCLHLLSKLPAVKPTPITVPAGSCYAFAAAGALETLVAIDREANAVSELSEADLVECQSSDSYGCDSSGSSCNGCNGGDPTVALEYALKQQGLPSAVDYPYGSLVSADTAGTCQVSKQIVA